MIADDQIGFRELETLGSKRVYDNMWLFGVEESPAASKREQRHGTAP
jgi:hypothetical protein